MTAAPMTIATSAIVSSLVHGAGLRGVGWAVMRMLLVGVGGARGTRGHENGPSVC